MSFGGLTISASPCRLVTEARSSGTRECAVCSEFSLGLAKGFWYHLTSFSAIVLVILVILVAQIAQKGLGSRRGRAVGKALFSAIGARFDLWTAEGISRIERRQ